MKGLKWLMDKKEPIFSSELKDCIERIERLYWYDTVTFLDCVLTDDETHPEFSAITACQRLSDVVAFDHLYYGKKRKTVNELLYENGYSKEDVELLSRKCKLEEARRESMY